MRFEEVSWAESDLFLMADERLIDAADGAAFRLCPMDKHPDPVLLPDQPWEGGDGQSPRPVSQDPVGGSVLLDPDDKTFHLWYRSHNYLLQRSQHAGGARVRPGGSGVCYATSTDGLHWDKPVVGTVAYEGAYDNNMVRIGVGPILSDHLSGVVPNRSGAVDAKLVASVYSRFRDPVYPSGITQLYSNDGLRWEPHFPPTLPLDGDAHCLMWDPHAQCYLCTTRSHAHAHEVRRMRRRGHAELRNKRHIAIARSRDLLHWTPMVTVLEADDEDPPNAQLYLMYVLPYGHAYVGLVQLFYPDEHLTRGPLEMQLAFSRDGLGWHRPGDRTPVLPRGPEGSWDQSHVTICTNPPFGQADRLRFWYGGKNAEHWQAGLAGMGTATLRRDGFACWQAGPNDARLTTVPLDLEWAVSRLVVNVEAPDGELRVAVLDADSRQPLDGTSADDCAPIRGDHVRALVEFGRRRGTFIRHTGRVRLRFHLRNARLYAFKATNLRIPESP